MVSRDEVACQGASGAVGRNSQDGSSALSRQMKAPHPFSEGLGPIESATLLLLSQVSRNVSLLAPARGIEYNANSEEGYDEF